MHLVRFASLFFAIYANYANIVFLASQDAQEVGQSVSESCLADFTDVTLVSEDAF